MMRRLRKYSFQEYDGSTETKDDEVPPRLPYFLSAKVRNNESGNFEKFSNKSFGHEESFSRVISSTINGFSHDTMMDNDMDYFHDGDRKDNCHSREDQRDRDEEDFNVYEVVVSDEFSTPVRNNRIRASHFSKHDLRKYARHITVPQKKPAKKKIVCKFCESYGQLSSCPCPVHLPTVQSRYMRVLQDNTLNAITINVFRNGDYRVTPTMIHISKFHMRSMEEIMKIVDRFVRFPVGYAYALYTVLGDLVDDPSELEPYEMYVVVNNCKKQFIPLEYGNKGPHNMNSRRRRTIPPSNFAFTPFHMHG